MKPAISSNDRVLLIKKATCMAGMTGVLIIVLGIVVSALAFSGDYGEPYSVLNHNISELGELEVSELAWLFNNSLVVGGLLLILFMLGMSLSLPYWPIYLVSLTGMVSVGGMIVSGLTPMVAGETSGLHMTAAQWFFYGGMPSTSIYSLYALLAKGRWFPRWTAVFSLFALISFWAFIYLPAIMYPGFTLEDYLIRMQGESRPDFFLPSLLEWLVMFSAVLWIAVVAYYVCVSGNE
jgi:hypothetical membrane protein